MNLDTRFRIKETSIQIQACSLHYPDIIFMGKRNATIVQGIDQIVWKETGGFLDGVRSLKEWCIVADRSNSSLTNNVYKFWQDYCGMRRFYESNIDPIGEPYVELINLNSSKDYERLLSHKPTYQMLLVIIPEGDEGSKIKATITKVVQSVQNGTQGILVQCVLTSSAENKNAMIGTFEDMMAKIGNILFRIDPHLPNGNKFIDINSTWCIGIDVSHNGGKPSVVTCCLQTKPLDGTTRGLHLISHFNPPRIEIIPFIACTTMIYRALEDAFKYTCKKDPKYLPNAIFVFRDGVADNSLNELYSKEVVGCQRGILEFSKTYKLEKWKPKLEFIVVSKSPIDRFGILSKDKNKKDVQALYQPAVIYSGITSARLWDFIIYPYHEKKRSKVERVKPLRYIVVKDELKLGSPTEHGNGGWDLFQFIYSLLYTYTYSIPFPLGGTSQPGPIVYAKHYAETFAQMILSQDEHIHDLQLAPNLLNRPHVIEDKLVL